MYYTFKKGDIDELKKRQVKVMKDLPVLKTRTLVFYSVPKRRQRNLYYLYEHLLKISWVKKSGHGFRS